MIIEQKIVKCEKTRCAGNRISIPPSPTGYYRRVIHDDGHIELFPFDMTRVKKDNSHPTPTKHFNTGAKIGANKRKKKESFDD